MWIKTDDGAVTPITSCRSCGTPTVAACFAPGYGRDPVLMAGLGLAFLKNAAHYRFGRWGHQAHS
jgi:hypothetical protein